MNNELAPGNVRLILVVCATAGPFVQLTSGLDCHIVPAVQNNYPGHIVFSGVLVWKVVLGL